MSATSAPFGFRPSYHNSGVVRQKAYTITSGLATDIFSGDPVKLNDNGTVQLGTSDGLRGGTVATINLLGILSGVEYTDSLGKPTLSNYWPSGTSVLANTTVTAWVYDDPETLFDVQFTNPSPASSVQPAVGDEADWVNATGGSAQTGLSLASLGTGKAGGQFQITGFSHNIADALTDTYITTTVRINLHHYKAAVARVS